MDAIRKQLDVLMGANRNGDVQEVNRKYYDRDVCRLYLAGLCPHDLFQLTKMDLGPCSKLHSLQLRKEYEEAKTSGTHNFDRELEDLIERLIVECERKIQRALKRLEEDDAKAAIAISVTEVTQSPEVMELSKQIKEKLKEVDAFDLEGKTDNKIRALEVVEDLRSKRADKQSMLLLDAFNKDRASLPQPLQNPPLVQVNAPPDLRTQEMINEKLKKAEELGEKGMIDEAQKALEEAEALKKLGVRLEPTVDPSKYTAADVRITDQKLRVCDICGAFLSVYDSDRRLADHFGGKLHLGYMQIREKLVEFQENAINEVEYLKRGIRVGRWINLKMIEGQENEVATGLEAGIVVERSEAIAVIEEGIMTAEVENMNAMIGTADMIENAREIPIILVIMTRGFSEGRLLARVIEIMIGKGAMTVMIDTEVEHL